MQLEDEPEVRSPHGIAVAIRSSRVVPVSGGRRGAEDPARATGPECHCPVCGERVEHEKCKVVCRSERCVYRIIYTCSEF
ncbi:MAG: hypothetical protein R3E12_00850 [Candidatus Eisenbacteria bacterium]